MPMQRRVVVVPYNPDWPAMFDAEAARVCQALNDQTAVAHHIGSTAVPGLHAKPVIDMLVEAADVTKLDARNDAIKSLGYEPMGQFGLPGRRFFRKDDTDGNRTHHVHAYANNNPEALRHLAFRDFMRAHPQWAQRYGQLKQRLAQQYPEDIEAYMDGKDPFIKDAEQRALAWHQANAKA